MIDFNSRTQAITDELIREHLPLLHLCSDECYDPEQWFASRRSITKDPTPVTVCADCPLRSACARVGLDTPGTQLYGVWAGQFFDRDHQPTDRLKRIAEKSPRRGVDLLVKRVLLGTEGPAVPDELISTIKNINRRIHS